MSALLLVQLIAAILLGALAMPFGLLPSVLLFRDLANGTDDTQSAKRLYAWSVWGGLGTTWLIGTVCAFQALRLLTG